MANKIIRTTRVVKMVIGRKILRPTGGGSTTPPPTSGWIFPRNEPTPGNS